MNKSFTTIILLVLGLTLVGCGGGTGSTNINGNWSASLTNSQGGPVVYSFNTTFTEVSGGGLSVTNFTLTSSNGGCFTGQTTETGNFTLSGNFSGDVTGTFGMNITSQDTGGQDVLTLQGGVGSNNTIAGTWSVSGNSGCAGQGFFTINRT